ncbi:nucleoside phosphorylase [Variovorax sp. Varisp62]|uniref:nucleoside phosphorylase n=1 Tax=Variovorax sp. Varisp62 TaxID=3243049 RepID=UPI0039B4478A
MTDKSSEPSRSARFPWREGRPPHLPMGPGEVPRIVLLPGDPARVDLAANALEDFKIVGQTREFRFGVGFWDGEAVGVCSTGIGGPSTEIAVVELANIGMEIAIRVGGMGAINPTISLGELLVVRESLRGSGAAAYYASPRERVLADPSVVEALLLKAGEMQMLARCGVVATVDSYYAGQGRPYRAGGSWIDTTADWVARGADGLEMETETVLAVARRLGVAAGAVLGAHNSRPTDDWLESYSQTQLNVLRAGAAAGVHVLRQRDASRR